MAERIRTVTPVGKEGEIDPKFAAGPIEEKLNPTESVPAAKKSKEADELEDDELETVDEESGPTYKREDIGPRLQDHAQHPGEAQASVEELKEELDADDLVPLLFPKRVMLQDKGLMHTWEAGVHLVPASLAKHWYMKQNKVKRAGAVIKRKPEAVE